MEASRPQVQRVCGRAARFSDAAAPRKLGRANCVCAPMVHRGSRNRSQRQRISGRLEVCGGRWRRRWLWWLHGTCRGAVGVARSRPHPALYAQPTRAGQVFPGWHAEWIQDSSARQLAAAGIVSTVSAVGLVGQARSGQWGRRCRRSAAPAGRRRRLRGQVRRLLRARATPPGASTIDTGRRPAPT